MLDVILSEVKDLTVGTRVYCCQSNNNDAKMIQSSLKILSAGERSLAALGMTG
jgi:hypothetical protein